MDMADGIAFRTDLDGIDWEQLKATLAADHFDNGRSADQLRLSFENSFAAVVAQIGSRVVGTARVLSDGVCNAYLVDVWTHGPHRRRGIARAMVETLLSRTDGQHVALFSDAAAAFYSALGFREEAGGMSRVVGRWLRREA